MRYSLSVVNGKFVTEKQGQKMLYVCSNGCGVTGKATTNWVKKHIKDIENAIIRDGKVVFVSNKRIKSEVKKVGVRKKKPVLTWEEEAALLQYKSSESYRINYMLRNLCSLDEMGYAFIDLLDSALKKLPIYEGLVYRNICFDSTEELDVFMESMEVGAKVKFRGYTSASTEVDGYSIDDTMGCYTVNMLIYGKTCRNLEGYGNNMECEVLFNRNIYFRVLEAGYNSAGKIVIYLQEV